MGIQERVHELTAIQGLIQSIRDGGTAIFCGAGISFHSGLPLAASLVGYLLEGLSLDKDDIALILNSPLPFEAFIEILRSNSDDILPILTIFKQGVPNHAHQLIARLARAGYLKTICTTNFDLLLERSLESNDLQRGRDYRTYETEDDFEQLSAKDDLIRLIKIHGTADKPETMAITLQQVSSRITSAKRQRAIDYVFSNGSHKNVLIIGYSCSDIFDVSPQIQDIRDNRKPVFLVDHSATEKRLADIQSRQFKNPFHKFSNSKWLIYDTDKIVETLWQGCLDEPFCVEISAPPNNVWKKNVDQWFAEMTLVNRLNIAGQLFCHLSVFDRAVDYFSRALPLSRRSQRGHEVGLLSNLASCWVYLDKYVEATKCAEEALALAQEGGADDDGAAPLNVLGAIFSNTGRYHNAKQCFQKVRDVARMTVNKKLELSALTSLGNTYIDLCDYPAAIDAIEQSVDVAKALGEKQSEVRSIASLGVAYSALGAGETALAKFKESLRGAVEIGDRFGEAAVYVNLGLLHHNRGDDQEALEALEHGQRIAHEVGNQKLERNAAEHCGHICLLRGDTRGAEDQYGHALAISRGIGDSAGEGKAIGNLGRVFNEYGNLRLAKEYYERALSIATQIGDKQGGENWTGNLGVLLGSEGMYTEAERKLTEALELASEIGDKENEALWTGHLGTVENYRQHYQSALRYFEQAVRLARECGSRRMESRLLGHCGDVLWVLGSWERAREEYGKAAAIARTILGDEHADVRRLEAKSKRVSK